MWFRIFRVCAYGFGIPATFLAILYAYTWYSSRPARLEARKFLEKIAARENALDSLGDIELDPTTVTLSKLEGTLRRPGLVLAGAKNSTRIGWACGDKELCEIWAFFIEPFGNKLDPNAMPVSLFVEGHLLRKPIHKISIGGIPIGESASEMKDFCAKRGYGQETAYHRMTWDKDWIFTWAETSGKITLLMFMNEKRLKNYQEPTSEMGKVKPTSIYQAR